MTELPLLIRATVILILGLGAVAVARRASAATRSLWLSVTFGALLLFPVATATLPSARIQIPFEATAAAPPARHASAAPGPQSVTSRVPAIPRRPAAVPLRQWLAGVWLA